MQIKCKKDQFDIFKSICFRPPKPLQQAIFTKNYQTNHLCQTDCLTTLCKKSATREKARSRYPSPCIKKRPSRSSFKWSGRRGSNSRHPPWQGGILPLNYPRNSYLYDTCSIFNVKCKYFSEFALHNINDSFSLNLNNNFSLTLHHPQCLDFHILLHP